MHRLWRQFIFELQFFDEIVHQFRREAQRVAHTELWNDVLIDRGAVFNIRRLFHRAFLCM